MKGIIKHLSTIAVVIFISTGCSVNVTEQMIVSPATEINQQHLNQLVNAQGYQETFFTHADGTKIHALELTRENAPVTLVVFHGNALNMTLQPWFGLLDSLAQFDVNIIAIDYQGFGKSEGQASFSNMNRDAELLMRSIDADTPVIIYGLSLGSVMAMNVSQDERVKGIILEGAVSNDDEMIDYFRNRNRLGSLASLNVDPAISFNNNSKTAHFDAPMLFIHGQNDENIPAWMTEALYESYQGISANYLLVESGGHCDTFHVEPALFADTIAGFLTQVTHRHARR